MPRPDAPAPSVRRGSFKRTHDNLVRDIAKVVTELDAARPIFRKS